MRRTWTFLCSMLCTISCLSPAQANKAIQLTVDATEISRKIVHAKMTIPVSAGPITLNYPEWIPGEHGPTGPIVNLAGLKFAAAGQSIPWRRDDVEMYSIHVQVPAGVTELEASFDFLEPSPGERFSSGASTSSQMAVLSWNQVLLYPAGANTDNITFAASLTLPQDWNYGTALPVASRTGSKTVFQPVNLTTLVDSPVIAGRHFREIPISPAGETKPHFLELAADSDAAIALPADEIAAYTRLVAETGALFGARHYNSYRFLVSLSDHVAHFGLEHHQSSDDRIPERTFIDPDLRKIHATLLTHEMTHSWNGKYRRPVGLATADFQQPMKGELLWVYEGLTNYLGEILAARSGVFSQDNYRELLATTAAYLNDRPGRTWRPLADTAIEAQILYNTPKEWEAWRRSVDYYDEGSLLWLEVDTIIRRKTNGAKSLNDFCRAFHGGQSGPPALMTYTLNDVVATLNQITPNNWDAFFQERLNSLSPRAPLGGIENSGWKLGFTNKITEVAYGREDDSKQVDLRFSLGTYVAEDGTLMDVIPGSPLGKAGAGPGMKLVAVNGRKYSRHVIHDALAATTNSSGPMELLLSNDDYYKTYTVDYHGGDRYPILERDNSKPDLLTSIISPLTPAK